MGIVSIQKETGLWQFYKAGGKTLFKEVDYKDTMILLDDTLKIHSNGFVKCYYDNGALMYEGYSISKEFQVVCEGSIGMPTDQIKYTKFYDTIGQPVLKEGNGYVEELQLNGYKLREGNLKHFLKEGIWIEYGIKGLPVAMGLYKQGKKEGRWLTGDLSGLNVGGDICFYSAEEFADFIERNGSDLELGEEYYVNGVLINSNEVNTVKR